MPTRAKAAAKPDPISTQSRPDGSAVTARRSTTLTSWITVPSIPRDANREPRKSLIRERQVVLTGFGDSRPRPRDTWPAVVPLVCRPPALPPAEIDARRRGNLRNLNKGRAPTNPSLPELSREGRMGSSAVLRRFGLYSASTRQGDPSSGLRNLSNRDDGGHVIASDGIHYPPLAVMPDGIARFGNGLGASDLLGAGREADDQDLRRLPSPPRRRLRQEDTTGRGTGAPRAQAGYVLIVS
jgi:hypothetical protein